jgi:O-antigen/teichoic acid export membrane protein
MIKSQNFYVRSSLFVTLSLTAAVINYVLYPVLARLFNLREFGDYVTIVSLSNQVMGVLLAFSVISIALVKQYGEAEAGNKAQIIQKVLLWLFLVLSILILLFTPLLKNLLNIQHAVSFFILSLILLLSVPANIWVGFLQGHKEQIRVGIFTVCSAVLKFVCIILLATRYGVVGGLYGFFLGALLGLFVLHYLPGRDVPKLNTLFKPLKDTDKAFIHEYKAYIIQTIFAVAGLVFLQNFDLNRAKVLLDPNIAGMYGGISVLSNALYYVAFLIIWILLPEFSLLHPHINKRILRTAFTLIASMAIAVVIGGLAFGDKILTLLLGQNFAHQGNTLVVASLYQISLVSVTLYVFYLLVLRQRRSIILTGSVLLTCFALPPFFNNAPFSMIMALWISVILGVLLYWVILQLRSIFMKIKAAQP